MSFAKNTSNLQMRKRHSCTGGDKFFLTDISEKLKHRNIKKLVESKSTKAAVFRRYFLALLQSIPSPAPCALALEEGVEG
ncbi:hypothetical protein [Neisseria chenwenguii]|uniref:hypothetical protein n=1 Tax=Neisseria chenwenguii TaxID=1853278 RepID=UPI000F4F7936|nr:hypothetical protein [Neisseria chenwenguii]